MMHRDIRKALAALARELNVSEGKRLEVEEALRSAGGGVGINEARGLDLPPFRFFVDVVLS